MSSAVTVRAVLAGLVLSALVGCSLLPGGESAGEKRRAEVLRERVQEFRSRFVTKLAQEMDDVERLTEDIEIRRSTVEFRLLMAPAARQAVYGDDPLTALLDIWALSIQTRDYFEEGPGRQRFGSFALVLAEESGILVEEAELIAEETLDEKILANARRTVGKFTDRYPAKDPFSRETIRSFFTTDESDLGIGWLFDTSLAPLRAIGGLDQTALAVREVAAAAEDMNSIVNEMPDRIRLQTKATLYDIGRNPTVASAIESFERVSKSSEQLTLVADELPTRIRTELQTGAESLPELDSTLRELRETLDAATRTTEALDRAGQSLQGTLAEFRTSMETIGVGADRGPPAPRDPDAPPEKPFDITEYTETALALSKAADSLRAMLEETGPLLAEEDSALSATTAKAESFAWTVTACALVFVFATSVIVLGHRRISRRFVARDAAPPTDLS